MTEYFTIEDFRPVAREIASYLNSKDDNPRPKRGLPLPPDIVREESEPFVYADPAHRMRNVTHLKVIFDRLLSTDYQPAKNELDFYEEVLSIKLFSSEISFHIDTAPQWVADRINTAFLAVTKKVLDTAKSWKAQLDAYSFRDKKQYAKIESEASRCYDVFTRLRKSDDLTHDTWAEEIGQLNLELIDAADVRGVNIHTGQQHRKRNITSNLMTQTLKRLNPQQSQTIRKTNQLRKK